MFKFYILYKICSYCWSQFHPSKGIGKGKGITTTISYSAKVCILMKFNEFPTKAIFESAWELSSTVQPFRKLEN